MPDALTLSASYWIDKLALDPHPEGGFYRQTYQSTLLLPHTALPAGFGGDRSASTAIYFLLEGDNFSAFHRIPADEMWHFYTGDPLSVHVLDGDGEYRELRLGPEPDRGECFQCVVPGDCWFASSLTAPHGFALVGCTVSPGFDFVDFAMADRADLIAAYPQHRDLITRFTRIGPIE